MTSKSNSSTTAESTPPAPTTTKTSQHAIRYLIVGVSITLFNYILYAVLSNLIIQNNDLLWLSTLISTVITTILAYILHSKITWKEREITKTSIYKFFIWNVILAVAIGPALTQIFSLLTPLYEFAFGITSAIHLPFTYEFVLTTGAFALTSAVIMVLNFFLYDRFVFGKKPSKSPASPATPSHTPHKS